LTGTCLDAVQLSLGDSYASLRDGHLSKSAGHPGASAARIGFRSCNLCLGNVHIGLSRCQGLPRCYHILGVRTGPDPFQVSHRSQKGGLSLRYRSREWDRVQLDQELTCCYLLALFHMDGCSRTSNRKAQVCPAGGSHLARR
jgi:hypothetical protein